MNVKPKEASTFLEAKDIIQEFNNRLPSKVEANKFGHKSKLAFKAISRREALLYRVTEMEEGSCRLYENNMMASVFALTRSALETSDASLALQENGGNGDFQNHQRGIR